MKCKLLKCGICREWNSAEKHCGYCGAYRLWDLKTGKVKYYNSANVEMVRGVPTPMHEVIERFVKYALACEQA